MKVEFKNNLPFGCGSGVVIKGDEFLKALKKVKAEDDSLIIATGSFYAYNGHTYNLFIQDVEAIQKLVTKNSLITFTFETIGYTSNIAPIAIIQNGSDYIRFELIVQ